MLVNSSIVHELVVLYWYKYASISIQTFSSLYILCMLPESKVASVVM